MPSIPYMKFFPGDWLRDTRALTASAKGAWIDLLSAMWYAPEPGVLCMKLSAFGRLVGLTVERTAEVFDELAEFRICEREELPSGELRLTSRRIVRDHAELNATSADISEKRSRASRTRWDRVAAANNGSSEAVNDHADTSTDVSAADACASAVHSTCNAGQKPDARIQNDLSLSPTAGAGEEAAPPSKSTSSPRRPTLEQARAAAATIGLTAEEADTWWHGREASGWMKAARHGAVMAVGANWQSDLRTYIAAVRETQATKAERAKQRGSSSTNYSRSSAEDHRAAKAAREYPEPERTVPWL